MNARIIYTTPNGSLAVIIPVRSIEDGHLTDNDILERAWERLQRDINPLPYYKKLILTYFLKEYDKQRPPLDKVINYIVELAGYKKDFVPTAEADEALTNLAQKYMQYLKVEPLEAINPQIIPADQIPADRYFRNAWRHGGNRVDVGMAAAREIHMARIREARKAKLEDLDGPWMRASGQGKQAEAAEIETRRQALRDIPQVFDLSRAQTPEELKALWPKELQ